jgi:hypothetical protein
LVQNWDDSVASYEYSDRPMISRGARKETGTCSHLFFIHVGQRIVASVLPEGVGAVTNEDLAAFTAFVVKVRASLYRAAYQLCGDWYLAEDLVQEAVVALYRQWVRLELSVGVSQAARPC